MKNIWKYKNKNVIVRANGVSYKGILKEITEEAVTLRGLTGWIEIPVSGIISLQGADEKKGGFREDKFIDKSFYDIPPDDDSLK